MPRKIKRSRRNKHSKSAHRMSLGGYRRTKSSRKSRRRSRRVKRRHHKGGVPNQNHQAVPIPLIRSPYTRANIINGYARSLYDEQDQQGRYADYVVAINRHLEDAVDNQAPVTDNELAAALDRVAVMLGHQ